jgi:putative transposase
MRTAVATRFPASRAVPAVQWLSDNESTYTALETVIVAEQLNLIPVTTQAYSPQSNGMAAAFVNTLRHNYIDGADRPTAAVLLAKLPA